MGHVEIDATQEFPKPKNSRKALDQFEKKPTAKFKAKAKPVAANDMAHDEPIAVASSDPYPAHPAKQPGVVTFKTRCENAACWRTYENGKQVFETFSSSWTFDSGDCYVELPKR